MVILILTGGEWHGIKPSASSFNPRVFFSSFLFSVFYVYFFGGNGLIVQQNWKARVSAYEELAKLFRTSVEDSDFRRFEGSLRKIALDSNAVAQESGLSTLIQFVENAPDPNR